MQAGDRLAHYTIVEKIGQGGMGEVFRATDANLGRDVALKMLPDSLAHDTERLARFRREAQVLAALNHPGIAAVYGLESDGNRHALAMELVTGPELAARLQDGPLSVDEGLQVALQLAEAVEAAHEKGIVHRDLKPSNIKLAEDGRVKVLDFGLAKALVDDPSGTDYDPVMSPTLTANMTMGNVILGTAAYMSPEQARGTSVDKRADIWAYGVVVTEMLGGRRLFQGETVSDTLASVLKSAIDLDALPEPVPHAVRRLLRRCLQRDPRQRLRDIGDARLVLQDVITGLDDAEPAPAPVAPANPWPLRGALAVALLAAAAAVFGFLAPDASAPPQLRKFAIPMAPDDPAVSSAFAPEMSHDGRYIAYLSDDQIWLRDLTTTESHPLPGTENAVYPFWSPDDNSLAFGRANSLLKVDRSGTRPVLLTQMPSQYAMGNAGSGIWRPDGTIFYTTGNSGLLRTSAQGGEVVVHEAQGPGEIDFHECCALPNDLGFVVVVHDTTDYGSLALVTADNRRQTIIDYKGDSLASPTWSPTGHILFQREDVAPGVWALPFSLQDLAPTGDAFLVAPEGKSPSVSQDGTLVYTVNVQQTDLQLVWVDRKGQELGVIGDIRTTRPFPALSPDESEVMIVASSGDSRELWIFDAEGGSERRVTLDDLQWGVANWHPDGRHAVTYDEGSYTTSLITLDGTRPPQTLGPGILAQITPDGETLITSLPNMDEGFDFDIGDRPVNRPTDPPRVVLQDDKALEWYPRLSPNGRYLLYTSNISGRDEVYAVTYPEVSGRWQISRDGGSWAEWRADGKEIFFATMSGLYSVTVEPEGSGLEVGRPAKLFERQPTNWSTTWPDAYAASADGQRFVLVRPAATDFSEPPALVVVQNWFAEFARGP